MNSPIPKIKPVFRFCNWMKISLFILMTTQVGRASTSFTGYNATPSVTSQTFSVIPLRLYKEKYFLLIELENTTRLFRFPSSQNVKKLEGYIDAHHENHLPIKVTVEFETGKILSITD